MRVEEILLLEPDDVTFTSLELTVLAEIALAETAGDSRLPISALRELSRRAYDDESARRSVEELATRLISSNETSPHLCAYAFSVLYWHALSAAVAVVPLLAATCPEVVLNDIVDCLTPDLDLYFDETDFRTAATVVAQRLESAVTIEEPLVESVEYLQYYHKLISERS